jgi:hypothetical protein
MRALVALYNGENEMSTTLIEILGILDVASLTALILALLLAPGYPEPPL